MDILDAAVLKNGPCYFKLPYGYKISPLSLGKFGGVSIRSTSGTKSVAVFLEDGDYWRLRISSDYWLNFSVDNTHNLVKAIKRELRKTHKPRGKKK